MAEILIKKTWTQQAYLASQEAGGKKPGRAAGGWIDDLAAQKKVITLCQACTHKFNPKKLRYRKEREFPVCQAKCDGCSTFDPFCSWYIYDELYTSVRSTTEERRALAHARAKRIQQGVL